MKDINDNGSPSSESKVVRFLRRRDVCELTGLKTSTLYEMMQQGTFPRPVQIAKRLVVWPETEVAAWQAGRIAERNESAIRAKDTRESLKRKLGLLVKEIKPQ